MVRQAVLKNKDPSQLIEEMEGIDDMGKNFFALNHIQCLNCLDCRIQCAPAVTIERKGSQREAQEAERNIRPGHATIARRRARTVVRI